jgi:MtN3 and saliva related transmembrane protein
MTETKDIFGYLGMVCLTITLIPQLVKVYRTKQAEDLSYLFLLLNVFTCVCFLAYGIILNETPLLIANTIVITQTIVLILLKYKVSTKTNQNLTQNQIQNLTQKKRHFVV